MMVDLLRRSLSPVPAAAWQEIDTRAAQVLHSQLTARRIVDFDGPHGWDFGAVNLGRLETSESRGPHEVPWGKRVVQPLVEARVPFTLDQMELDSIARGARDPDLAPLEGAARRIALFEESAVYNGFEPGGIEGVVARSAHEPIGLPDSPPEYPEAIARAVTALTLFGIQGPYVLVLGTDAWTGLMQSGSCGYPPERIIRTLTGGSVHMSPVIEGGILLSAAKGNFELVVGQDFSIGYVSHDRDKVELYLTESFTLRVLEPSGGIRLTVG